jgi:G3E family GTPase
VASDVQPKGAALSVQSPLPVVVVTGLHRAQRRRAVRELVTANPGTVVLEHDLSHAGHGEVLRRLWDDRGGCRERRLRLTNDCPCCALRADLLPELARLAKADRHRLAVVELWGGSDAQTMVETLALGRADGCAMTEFIEIVGVVTAVDALRLVPELSITDLLSDHGLHTCPDDERTLAEALAHQIEYAGVLAVDAGQAADNAADARAGMALLRQLHPSAQLVGLGTGGLPGAARSGFDVLAAADRVSPPIALLPHPCEYDSVATLVWRRRRPLHPGRLFEALDLLAPAAQRSQGRFWLANRPGVLLGWDAAGGSLAVEDCGPWLACVPDEEWAHYSPQRRVAAAAEWDARYGDRVQLLAFTARDLDADGITELLDSCLLTDDELDGGEESWKALPDAFGELLDPVP